ncbi:unnamed protein product [Mytilus coruscus]|uniref:Uncharacterized protein n=1 Tax=Mytilus coruscus TaxID=42192 RepID=A0A6J8EJB2_MYTCO|nr:unnamed protein product [Mytilus coruscus]
MQGKINTLNKKLADTEQSQDNLRMFVQLKHTTEKSKRSILTNGMVESTRLAVEAPENDSDEDLPRIGCVTHKFNRVNITTGFLHEFIAGYMCVECGVEKYEDPFDSQDFNNWNAGKTHHRTSKSKIEDAVSRALDDDDISDIEFTGIVKCLNFYYDEKQHLRQPRKDLAP